MLTAIEYERLKTSIVDFNLSIAEEPYPDVRSGNSPNGFLAECYLGPRDSQNGSPNSYWHVHYRE
jgi:hypothetical protein